MLGIKMLRISIIFLFGILNLMAEDISFSSTIFIKASKTKVWNALVEPKEVSKYFMCPMIRMGNKIGDSIEYGIGKDVMISGKIVEIKVEDTLSYSFLFDPESHIGTEKDAQTVVKVTISEDNGVTTLELVHGGFHGKDQTYANIVGGWPWIISNLKTYLETGKTLNEK